VLDCRKKFFSDKTIANSFLIEHELKITNFAVWN